MPIIDRDLASGSIVYKDPDTGKLTHVPVTRGHCKLQWKADWAMRWAALGVDYEMAGKDLIDSVRLSGHICRILGAQQPEGFIYELFLDEKGEKISKSRGNGLTIEEWLTYAAPESLSLYMYQSPRKAKRLYFDVIPRAVDEYVGHLAAYPKEEPAAKLMNRSGTSMKASRRRPSFRSASRFSSILLRRRTRRTARCCGASSAAMRLTPRRKRTRCSISSSATPSATSMTS